MAAKYILLVADGKPVLCPQTGAQLAEMPVKVGKLTPMARKRIFTDTDQLGGLLDEELLKMVNYAEDLFARAACTREHTPKGEKELHRTEARQHWALQDKANGTTTLIDYLLGGPTAAMVNAKLDAYWEENCKPEEPAE